jgi:antitoxin component YwqK of YwqJK toxin-antitoxin module
MYAIIFLLPYCSFSQPEKINQTDSKGLKQGKWEKKFDNGKIRYSGTFKDDKPIGTFNYYYESGVKKSVLEYITGTSSANAVLYHENGKKASEGKYLEQQKDGEWLYYNEEEVLASGEFFLKGIKQKLIIYYPNGKVSETCQMNGEKKHGECIQYFENGEEKFKATFQNNEVIGIAVYKHPNGKLRMIGEYLDAKPEGDWSYFDENGDSIFVIKYYKGVIEKKTIINGPYQEFYNPSGILKEEGTIKNRKKNGPFKIFYENGKWVKNTIIDEETGEQFEQDVFEGQTLKTEGTYQNGLLKGKITHYKEDGSVDKIETVE